jgi:hypothetical protein
VQPRGDGGVAQKAPRLAIDALFSGHLAFSLNDGQRHIETANRALDALLIPNQMVMGW